MIYNDSDGYWEAKTIVQAGINTSTVQSTYDFGTFDNPAEYTLDLGSF
jgi:hypothetical protein